MSDQGPVAGALHAPCLEGLRAGELRYQRCEACGAAQRGLRYACTRCGGEALSWQVASGLGSVHAVTEVRRAPTPRYRARVPYTLVLVDLEEGPRVMGHGWPGAAIGDSVAASVEPMDGRALLRFHPHALQGARCDGARP